ncbi:hypothetical protein [Caballeronia sordidicola]|uniref:hypothetical protein n=1 Tax=Caballeronia sordidicola TaxID=196367 RepID=UPI000B76D84B|nr:hypothetical protein [Caballeronia sordidicola]
MSHVRFPHKVVFPISAELVCFHEAGHVAAAVPFGVMATAMYLCDADSPDLRGKTTLTWNGDQGEAVACGGFAAERHLYDSGRLVDSVGRPIKQSDFVKFAVGVHAADDKTRYFGADHSRNGFWPAAMDQEFMTAAQSLTKQAIRFDVVTALAEALLAERTLLRDQIADVIRAIIGDETFDQIGWRDE